MTLKLRSKPAHTTTTNYVCFKCREAEKHKTKCPTCDSEMVCIGYWREPPRKTNKNKWKQLERRMKKIIPLSIDSDVVPMTIGHRGIVKLKYNRAKEKDNSRA